MAGLLGDFLDDPTTQLGMGLLGGSSPFFGQNLAGAYQQMLAQRQEAMKRQMLQQQIESGSLDLQQKKQSIQDQEQLRQAMQQFQPPPMPQQGPQGPGQNFMGANPDYAPPQVLPGGKQTTLGQPTDSARQSIYDAYLKRAQQVEKLGTPVALAQAKQMLDTAEKFRPELKDTKTQVDPRTGQRVTVNYFKDGSTQIVPFAPDQEKLHFANLGNVTQGLDPMTGKPVGQALVNSQSPDALASNAIARAHLGVTAASADPFGVLGIRDIAARAGAPVGTPPLGGQQGPASAMPAAAASQPSGDELLKTLPPQIGSQVKALAEGRQPFPGGFAMKSPYWQMMMNLVGQYDPNFDMVNYNARSGVRKDFTSGKSAISLNALNTVAGHLDQLDKAVDNLGNTNFTPYNMVANPVKGAFGSTSVTNFQTVLQTVMPELERAYRGSGGSEGSLQRWQKALSGTNGYEQQKAAIRELATLLSSKIGALGDQYDKGMGTTRGGLQLLNPKAQATFSRLTGEPINGNAQGGVEMSGFKVLGKE